MNDQMKLEGLEAFAFHIVAIETGILPRLVVAHCSPFKANGV